MRLFRKSEEKIALEAAADDEIRRLKGLSAQDLASSVLPALGPEGPGAERSLRSQELCEYLLRDFPGIGQMRPLQLMAPMRRACGTLEDAGLISSMSVDRYPRWSITSAGRSALAEGSTARQLASPEQSAAG